MSEYFEEEEFTTQFNGRTLLRTARLAKPYWKWVVGFLALVSIVALLDSYFAYIRKLIIDDGILSGSKTALAHMLGLYGGSVLLQAAVVLGMIFLAALLGERLQYDLRQKMFDHLQDLSFSYFNRTPVGWIMARVSSDSSRIAELVTWGTLDSTWGLMSILTSAYFMFSLNWKLALIVLGTLPLLFAIAVYFKKKIILEFRRVRKLNSKIVGTYNENITGVRVVKALCREEANLREFSTLAGDMYNSSFRAAWLSALFLPLVQVVSAVAIGGVVWIGGRQVEIGGLSIGTIQAFITYVTFMMWPIQDLARVYAEMQHAVASAERVFSLLDAVPEVTDVENAMDPGTIRGQIEFDHVNFSYEDGKPVLRDLSLQVQPGETIALVGPTGGGKTTLVNLMCRFYEPQSGVIRIGGRDYRELTTYAIQSRIGVVLQTPHLFSGTIRENIRYGRLDATDEEVEQAARLAGAHDFIATLEKGYKEEVGEGGNRLSVGQKQLVSLARAILARPEIFIMDEATSSVDTLTEALIQQGMETLMKGCTSFIIAHRLSTIRRADRILVIEDGTIREMGSHAELIRQRGKYYELYTRQFRDELERAYDPFQSAAKPRREVAAAAV